MKMASYPGPTLEAFLDDLYYAGALTDADRARWEPQREAVEAALAKYQADGGEETQSWRDFRNSLADLHAGPSTETQEP